MGPLRTKSGWGLPGREGEGWRDVLGGDFISRGPNQFLKVIKFSHVRHHMVESLSLIRPLEVFQSVPSVPASLSRTCILP